MTYTSNTDTKQATIEWLENHDTSGFEFVTLLMKQSARRECPDGVVRVDVLDEIKASRCFREFHNRLSRKVLQSDYRVRNRKLCVVPFLENKNGNFHYHLGIENPYEGEIGRAKFISYIQSNWRKCPFAFADRYNTETGMYEVRSVVAVPTYDNRWIGYSQKNQCRNWNDLDINNLYLGKQD